LRLHLKQVIHTGLPALAQPLSWAVRAGGMVFTTHGPVKHDVQMELGPVELPTVDAVYRQHFQVPYPNRSALAVSALAVPGMRIELVACACIDTAPSALRT
jgi:2-iminobutanoate/2-iminopropanoate deaminase